MVFNESVAVFPENIGSFHANFNNIRFKEIGIISN